ncbi:unnamed protein product [Closterium sp. NIES-64]|nr:unnamed protein product [Closterium sp. NIES-64]
MEWLTSAEGVNARQELEASVHEHHPHLRDEEVDLIVDGRLLRMVWERAAEQAPASGQQGGTGVGGAVLEAPTAVGIDGGGVALTIDTGMIGTSYGQFKFGVEHISVTPLLEGRHDLTAWTQLAQLRKGDDETAESYCYKARTIRAELLTIGQEVHMATFAAHVLKGLPREYGFLRRKLKISSPDMTVERVCSEVLMEEQTLSIEQSYKHITSDVSAFSGADNTIMATTEVNGKEGKGGREQMDKKKDGKREKKRALFKGRCYNCNEEGHMAAKCPNKKKDTTPTAAANVAEGDEKEENDEAANLTTYAVGTEAMLNLRHTHLENDHAGVVQWTATNSGMLGMDLEKGGTDTSSASSQEAKLTRQTLPLPDEREGEVLGMVHGPEQNQPPSRIIIIIPVPSVQGGKQPFDRSVDSAGSNANMAPLALCPSLAAGLAPVGPEVGLSADGRHAADEDKEGEATDLKSTATRGKDPIPTVPPLQPIPPPPCHSSRSNKGMPPVRLPASTMTALDAVDDNNMYGIAFLAGGAYGTDIYYDVEYLDEAYEEEGGLRRIIINLEVTLTGPEGKVVDKGLLMADYMSSTKGYLGLQIVCDHPNKTLLLH